MNHLDGKERKANTNEDRSENRTVRPELVYESPAGEELGLWSRNGRIREETKTLGSSVLRQ